MNKKNSKKSYDEKIQNLSKKNTDWVDYDCDLKFGSCSDLFEKYKSQPKNVMDLIKINFIDKIELSSSISDDKKVFTINSWNKYVKYIYDDEIGHKYILINYEQLYIIYDIEADMFLVIYKNYIMGSYCHNDIDTDENVIIYLKCDKLIDEFIINFNLFQPKNTIKSTIFSDPDFIYDIIKIKLPDSSNFCYLLQELNKCDNIDYNKVCKKMRNKSESSFVCDRPVANDEIRELLKLKEEYKLITDINQIYLSEIKYSKFDNDIWQYRKDIVSLDNSVLLKDNKIILPHYDDKVFDEYYTDEDLSLDNYYPNIININDYKNRGSYHGIFYINSDMKMKRYINVNQSNIKKGGSFITNPFTENEYNREFIENLKKKMSEKEYEDSVDYYNQPIQTKSHLNEKPYNLKTSQINWTNIDNIGEDYTKIASMPVDEKKDSVTIKLISFIISHPLGPRKIYISIPKCEHSSDYFKKDNIEIFEYHNKYFNLFAKYKLNNRNHVLLSCFDYDLGVLNINAYYTSLSGGKFWRLWQSSGSMSYDKGYDYENSTMINLYLQKYIEKNIKNIKKLNYEIKLWKKIHIKTNENYKRLHERPQYNNELFEVFEFYNNVHNPHDEELWIRNKELEEIKPDVNDNIKICIDVLIHNMKEMNIYDSPIIKKNTTKRNPIGSVNKTESVDWEYDSKYNIDFVQNKLHHNSNNVKVRKFYIALLKTFSHFFKKIAKSEYLFSKKNNYLFEYMNVFVSYYRYELEGSPFNGKVYKVFYYIAKLKNQTINVKKQIHEQLDKIKSNKYSKDKLKELLGENEYTKDYDIPIPNLDKYDENSYTLILYICPLKNNINHLGLDIKYCPCGHFIHKLFDYKHQIQYTKSDLREYDKTDKYKLIGHLYDINGILVNEYDDNTKLNNVTDANSEYFINSELEYNTKEEDMINCSNKIDDSDICNIANKNYVGENIEENCSLLYKNFNDNCYYDRNLDICYNNKKKNECINNPNCKYNSKDYNCCENNLCYQINNMNICDNDKSCIIDNDICINKDVDKIYKYI